MRVSPIVGRAAQLKSYGEFQAHITGLAVNGSLPWSGAVNNNVGAFKITTGAVPGYAPLFGSSWGPLSPDYGISGSYSYWPRAIQHAMPSEAVFNAIIAIGGEIFIRVQDGGIINVTFPSATRNGFTSSTGSGGTYSRFITEMLIFDPASGPLRMQPKLGIGPNPYTW